MRFECFDLAKQFAGPRVSKITFSNAGFELPQMKTMKTFVEFTYLGCTHEKPIIFFDNSYKFN